MPPGIIPAQAVPSGRSHGAQSPVPEIYRVHVGITTQGR